MDYSAKWKILGALGEGGQGKVLLAINRADYQTASSKITDSIRNFFLKFNEPVQRELSKEYEVFREGIINIIKMEDASEKVALKVLHNPEDARDAELAGERIKLEIQAMSAISHPNLLKVVDHDSVGYKWFASEYYPKGTLFKNLHLYRGNFPEALRALRPIVEGVAKLHEIDIVHRDIKPQNVFINSKNALVLGDFGLVYLMDGQLTRISHTLENVGSRDWMPVWPTGRKEKINKNFDVFSLGKLLWAMVSGLPFLRLWYFLKEEFNVEKMFPNAPAIQLVNPLLAKCIVENEEDCLPDAKALLAEIDKILMILENNADRLSLTTERRCKVCGIGNYTQIANGNGNDPEVRKFGIIPGGPRIVLIFSCSHCGHVQFFTYFDQLPDAWEK